MNDKPTLACTPEDQYEAGLAAGLSPEQMLANLDAKISRTAENIAEECRRAPFPEYAEKYIRDQAEQAIGLRRMRAYLLHKILSQH